MCLKTCSLGQPKPGEEILVDNIIIEKCLGGETLCSHWSELAAQELGNNHSNNDNNLSNDA